MNAEYEYLFLFITAIVFTFAGRYMERKRSGDLTTRIIEATVDRIGLEYNELSGLAKDTGSAAVFFGLLQCVIVWSIIIYSLLVP